MELSSARPPSVAGVIPSRPPPSSSRPRLHHRHTDVQDDPNGGPNFVCLFVNGICTLGFNTCT
ncbi:hypothetical protein HanIR_Chr11g0509581 [Helianthus annuus]|nr:hypothetical protein HanIR_Chr11g0509581 [Helianthus annuus]